MGQIEKLTGRLPPLPLSNFWNTSAQEKAINGIGKQYDFTKRLRASITNWDRYRKASKIVSEEKKRSRWRQHQTRQEPNEGVTPSQGDPDPELGLEKTDHEQGSTSVVTEKTLGQDETPINEEERSYFQLVQSSMSYITVDHGAKCKSPFPPPLPPTLSCVRACDGYLLIAVFPLSLVTCIGANWPHLWPGFEGDDRMVPPKHWVWLTLCKTGRSVDTVISINEAPNLEEPPDGEDTSVSRRLKEIAYVRHNTLAVLQQISTIGIDRNKHSALSLKAIREPPDDVGSSLGRGSPAKVGHAGASNIFYYLFEDIGAIAPILAHSKGKLESLVSDPPFDLDLGSPRGYRTAANFFLCK